jgi:hypothetical protein
MTDQPQASNASRVAIERVQELTWALLDEQITSDEKSLLENALLSDAQARETYVDCVQLQADLISHFAGDAAPPAASASSKTPVLGFLNAGMPPLGLPSNLAEGTSS